MLDRKRSFSNISGILFNLLLSHHGAFIVVKIEILVKNAEFHGIIADMLFTLTA